MKIRKIRNRPSWRSTTTGIDELNANPDIRQLKTTILHLREALETNTV